MRIICMAVITLDGKLAHNSEQFVDWSSKEDKRLFMQTTRDAGVLIMGHHTYKTMSRPLPGRLHIVLTSTPEAETPIPGVVEYTSAAPPAIAADLAARGYPTAILGGGGQVNRLFLEHDLIDELWLTVEPLIFGGGIDLVGGGSFDRRGRLIHLEQLNPDTIHLRYSLR